MTTAIPSSPMSMPPYWMLLKDLDVREKLNIIAWLSNSLVVPNETSDESDSIVPQRIVGGPANAEEAEQRW